MLNEKLRMETIFWGHKFDYRTRKCQCGLSDLEYAKRKLDIGEQGNYRCELVGDTELRQMFKDKNGH